jgi:hypothetical protein
MHRVDARIKLVTRMIAGKFEIIRGTIGAISNIVQYVHFTVLQIGHHGCLLAIIFGTISAICTILCI